MTPPRDDRGAITLIVVSVAAVLMLLGTALAFCVALVVAHRAAQSAADLAALGAAREVALGSDACREAAAVAAANRAHLVACSVSGANVTVTVTVAVGGPGWRDFGERLSASARAGPT